MRKPLIKTSIIVLALGATALAIAAAPDTTPKDTSRVMSKIDTDNDGTISLDEAGKAAAAKFDALDTDKEGTLDASELIGIMGHAEMAKADPDQDGTLDRAEYLAIVEALFHEADTDKDGTLEAKELSSRKGIALVVLLAY